MDYFDERDHLVECNVDSSFDFCNDDDVSVIKSFYNETHIFITGGSGFMGKVVIEKLLRSCDVGKIYLLMRPKRGKSAEDRIKEQFNDELFLKMKLEKPKFLEKVQLITGDCDQYKLGLSKEDEEFLIENVNIVIHAAATLSMNELISTAYNINVQATKQILELFEKMQKKKSFVYVSTAYAHSHRTFIGEKFYPTSFSDIELSNILQLMTKHDIGSISPLLIYPFKNSYSFSKAIAEEVCREFANKGLPVGIVRPSIVVSTYKEPLRNWTNNVYGAIGVLFGSAMGLLHVFYANPDAKADVIPVDMAANTIIASVWDITRKSLKTPIQHYDQVENIYNIVSSTQKPITWREYKRLNELAHPIFPVYSKKVLYTYSFNLIKNSYWYHFNVLMTHVLPAMFFDMLLKIKGKPPMLMKIYRKVTNVLIHFYAYAEKDWQYENYNVQQIWKSLPREDQKTFFFNVSEIDWIEFYNLFIRGIKQYILKENSSDEEINAKAKRKVQRLEVVHFFVKYGTLTLLSYLLYYGVYSVYNTIK